MVDCLHLQPRHRRALEALLREHLPDVEVWAYGSRVNGRSHDGSDLDLVLRGPGLKELPAGRLLEFEDAVRESNIPFLVEARDWARLPERFHREIERDHAVLMGTDSSHDIEDWREGKLGDVVNVLSGGTPSMKEPAYWHGSVPWVSAKDMKTFRLRDTADHVTNEGVANGTRLVPTGSVLLLTRGMTLLDRLPVCVTLSPMTFNQDVKALLPKAGVEPCFLPYLILGNRLRLLRLVDLAGHGTGRLSSDDLKTLVVRLPSRLEQQAIAHTLGTLDDRIELTRRMSATLDAIARGLFKSWFIDFDPVRAKMEGRDTGLPKDIDDMFPDRLVDSELGEMPEGWGVGVLDDAVEILSGGTPSTSVALYWNGDIPWYTAKDAPPPSDVFVVATDRTITQAGVRNSSTSVLPPRTTVISARGTVGRLACLGRPMAMNQTCYGIRGSHGYQDFFTYWLVRNSVEELRSRTHGTIFDTITRKTFAFISVPMPPVSVAEAFECAVTPIMERILSNLHQASAFAALREALLPRLISGDLRMHDVEPSREERSRSHV